MSYSLFGALGLLLASVGLFGLMSYNVNRRTREIGIRLAVGAGRRDIVRMVVGESLLLVLIGAVIGIGASLAAGRMVRPMLFSIAPGDLSIIAIAIGTMLAITIIAGYVPARGASRIDPMGALHYE